MDNILLFNEGKELFEYWGRRPNFKFEIPNVKFQDGSERVNDKEKDKDICHSISFFTIATALVNALNLFKYKIKIGEDNALECLKHFIAGTIVSVKTERVYIGDGDSCYTWISTMCGENEEYAKQHEKYLELINEVVKAARFFSKQPKNFDVCRTMAAKASEIASLLNSEPMNLRYGFGNWNRSIGKAYDPISCDHNKAGILLTNTLDNIRITNLLNYTLGAEYNEEQIPGNEDALMFFTCEVPDPKDSKKNIYQGICHSDLPREWWMTAKKLIPCEYPIYNRNYLHCDENADPTSWSAEQIPTYIDDTP